VRSVGLFAARTVSGGWKCRGWGQGHRRSKSDALPERVQQALGELAGVAQEGLLALSVALAWVC
jgi:hypothetical protein